MIIVRRITGCRLPGMALLGGDLPPSQNGDGITVRSFVECRTACRNQDGCEAFTFVKEWDANCFLKNGRLEESEFEGAISGTLAACEDSGNYTVPLISTLLNL